MEMKRPVKNVAAIHDLSGIGRASLTMILPILSTMGVQVCPLPTAVLSSTTDFEQYSFLDLTDYMKEYIENWKRQNLEFDCIYSGFLGSSKQIDIIEDFISYFKSENNLVVIDPVLGDNGSLYETMDDEMVQKMRRLVSKADMITPNFTEALYLLQRPYSNEITKEEIKKCLKELSDMGPKTVIVTSVPDRQGAFTNTIAYEREADTFWKVSCKYIPASYPGTGDAYASVIIGSLLQGDSLPIALDRGVQFVTQCIRASYGFQYDHIQGVLFERVLDTLKMPVISASYEMI